MNKDLEEAFDKFDQCMESFGKGMSNLFDSVFKNKVDGTKISIKKGSTIYVGKGVYAKLLDDVEAVVTSTEEEKKVPD
jgi:hypothetical protein